MIYTKRAELIPAIFSSSSSFEKQTDILHVVVDDVMEEFVNGRCRRYKLADKNRAALFEYVWEIKKRDDDDHIMMLCDIETCSFGSYLFLLYSLWHLRKFIEQNKFKQVLNYSFGKLQFF